ncbi:MAG: NAD(+)/NADH kinase [Alphaproteobacteria bacterium]|nr:NAD(+)/NADH kinase [Alphaproteobacteria bacterium]
MILADPRNPVAARYRDELARRLPAFDPDDVVVVIGGDGFMLHTVAEHGLQHTYLGLNAGRIGFLMNDVEDWDAVADQLARHAWTPYTFPVLEAQLRMEDGSVRPVHAVNDVVLERSTGQTAHLVLTVDGREVVDLLVCDGIVFSTALGSTAYTFSAGGPACHPTLDLLSVTAISPHRPRLSPFLLPREASSRVDVVAAHRRPVRAVVDGTTIEGVVGADVRLDGQGVTLCWLAGHDLTTRMISKIVRP